MMTITKTDNRIDVRRTDSVLYPQQSRVIDRILSASEPTIQRTIDLVRSLSQTQCQELCDAVIEKFEHRHRDYRQNLIDNYEKIVLPIAKNQSFTKPQQLLLGSYFTFEYALESAALCNPSIVPHPDQSNLPSNHLRFVLSLRAIGEGHISSLTFRTGIIDDNNAIHFDPISPYATAAALNTESHWNKERFISYFIVLQAEKDIIDFFSKNLPLQFETQDLENLLALLPQQGFHSAVVTSAIETARHLLRCHYVRARHANRDISECVFFPEINSPIYAEIRNGIEDARFVQFTNDKGEHHYYATGTAYSGRSIKPKLIHSKDFSTFHMMPLQGAVAHGKGMALFPRKIDGKYVMLARQDMNNYVMFSDNLCIWHQAIELNRPSQYWDILKVGNCGSPIETESGWLVITHGKGLMGSYSLGAMLLDLQDPRKVIGQLEHPLLISNEQEREGYVPNVVYSCGSLKKDNTLFIAYGVSDRCSNIATVEIDHILAAMK